MSRPERARGTGVRPALLGVLLLSGCAAVGPGSGLATLPALDRVCLEAQRIVSRTQYPVEVVIHDDFQAFVKSKAVIDGPEIQQYHWTSDTGEIVGVSCKLKSADHLNLAFGDGTAGPDGRCQDFNRAVYRRARARVDAPVFDAVLFDPNESTMNAADPNMTGPDWLRPYTALRIDLSGDLVIRAKGFRVDFTDPRFAEAPPRFRGIHYCHFVAPDYLRRVLAGEAPPRVEMGRDVGTGARSQAARAIRSISSAMASAGWAPAKP